MLSLSLWLVCPCAHSYLSNRPSVYVCECVGVSVMVQKGEAGPHAVISECAYSRCMPPQKQQQRPGVDDSQTWVTGRGNGCGGKRGKRELRELPGSPVPSAARPSRHCHVHSTIRPRAARSHPCAPSPDALAGRWRACTGCWKTCTSERQAKDVGRLLLPPPLVQLISLLLLPMRRC